MKAKTVVLLIIAIILIVGISSAIENKGAENITLAGGKSGEVSFPHHRHQNVLVDCNICHSLFPQKKGIIEELKAQVKLEKKQIMNKLCTKCHREKKKTGEKTGPVTCTSCHIKK